MASLEDIPHLWRLSLYRANIGDAGLRYLSRLPRLAVLDLRRTRVTNACLPTLAAMPLLRAVLVGGTRISDSVPGFFGVLTGGSWYASEAKAKEAAKRAGIDYKDSQR